jgi:hypothetical protein
MARLDTDEVATHWLMIQSAEVATPTVHGFYKESISF